MATIIERIKQFIDNKGLTIASFEKSIGMSNASFSKSLKNKGAIGTDKLENILTVYRELNPEWLLTGNGNMIKNDKTPIAIHAKNAGEGIPLVPVCAMAGALRGETTILELECEHYVVPVFKDADFLIPVRGSSMYPKYSSGDIVACKRVPMSGLFFQWNKVYVLDTDQGAIIKRINPGSNKEHVLIVSENEKYVPFELPISSIYAVAIVIGAIRLE